MRILQLGKFYPVRGGVEKVMYDLMTGISERGVRCDMLCAALEGKTRTLRINDCAELTCCRSWMKLAATMISPALVFRLRAVCHRYEIIHVHHPDPMACLALFCSGYRGKVVLHWHSDILKQKHLLKLYRPLQRWLINRADVVVGTTPVYLDGSPFLKEVESKVVLPIGVRPLRPSPEGVREIRNRYPGRCIVYSLGRLIGYKGFSYLVEAARYLDDRYVILIGGSGPLHAELQHRIEEGKLENKVKLLGFVPEEKHADYFGACDVFCLSSVQKTEAFGIVQIEAMSCGKPVVATRIPDSGVAWVNSDGVSGVNVEPCDARALAGAIRTITEDRDRYDQYCKDALNRYECVFTEEKMIDNCLTIYEKYAKQ